MERIISIDLFGEHYKFKADAEDTHAQKVVDYLEGKVSEVKSDDDSSSPDMSKFAHLLLATLNICNEYFDLKEEHDALVKKVTDRSSKLVEKIDLSLK